ncbi:MAG: PmoA family protein [Bacteroidales bacterium]|nr:PmoA family protein [Bacteroidales bacterium]
MNKIILIISLVVLVSCNTMRRKKSSFIFIENDQGVELLEKGQKIYFYQKAPVLSGGIYYKHYIHPLYNLSGKLVTRAYPEEEIEWHYNHRGMFWGWRQMFIQNEFAGDGWVMDGIDIDIKDVQTSIDNKKAQLFLHVNWITTRSEQAIAFIDEHTTITVYPTQNESRTIDFEISLKALVPGVEIAGSDDDYKGYGGFSIRIASPETLLFRSQNGPEEPQTAQLHIGPWVDFSTPGLSAPYKYGLSLFCHPSIPNFPSPWLLRSEGSMQNPAYPGWDRTMVSMDQETILRYRIILHDGDAEISDINNWYSEYASGNEFAQQVELCWIQQTLKYIRTERLSGTQ